MPDVPLASLAPQSPLQQQVTGFPAQAGGMIANALGITDALKALRGEMTPEEAQGFALSALPGLIPGAGEAGPLMRGAEKLAPEAAEAAIPLARGIRAFHGSPYDFPAERLVQYPSGETAYIQGTPQALPDVPQGATVLRDFPLGRMRLDKIGTGEGAQAYGHGLYNAEEERVAQGYRDALSNDPYRYASEIAPVLPKQYQGTRDSGLRIVKDIQDAMDAGEIKKPEEFLSEYSVDPALRPAYEKAASLLANGGGKMYEVNIAADPEHFLDWDKPLSEQSSKVQEALSQLGYFGEGRMPATGYHKLAGDYGGPDMASEKLRQAGIPGIKYLDQGSRNAGQFHVVTNMLPGENEYLVHGPGNISYGSFKTRQEAEALANQKNTEGQTHNYVVFDDKLVDILKKYGLAGLLGGGGVGAMMQNKVPLSSLQQ